MDQIKLTMINIADDDDDAMESDENDLSKHGRMILVSMVEW